MQLKKHIPVLFGVLGLFLVLCILFPLLEAIAYAVLLYYLSRPIVRYIEPVLGRTWSSLLVLVTLVLSIFALIMFLSVQTVSELSAMSPDTLVSSFVSASRSLSEFLSKHPEFNPVLDSLSRQLESYTQILAGQVISLMWRMVNLAITLVMAFVIAFFLLLDDSKLRRFLDSVFPKKISSQFDRIDANLYGIYVGSLLSAFIVGLITGIVFQVFGLPYPVISGILAAILQFIPMVGPQLFLIPGAFVAFVYKAYFQAAVLLALAVFLFFVPDNVIKPIIMKRTTGIHPLLVLLSFIGGVVLFGPPGFVIGPAILAVGDGLIHAWLSWE